MAVVTMRQLLESGVHFGHQTRRWNPKMKRFIFTERNGIYIIDLLQSLSYIDRAYEFVKETVAHGGTVLFIGTKKQAQEAIADQATRVGMPYVNERWLGGMLTNFQTVHKRLQRMKELEAMEQSGWEGTATKPDWSRPLPPLATDAYGVVFRVPTAPGAIGLRFVVHRGDHKDLPDDQRLDLTETREVWMLSGTVSPVRPDLGTLGPELDPARGDLSDVGDDAVTVLAPLGQRGQDQERRFLHRTVAHVFVIYR